MADIRSYLKEKEKREQNQINYKEKIRKHRLTGFYRILLVVAALGALAAMVIVQYKNHVYTGYDIVSSINRETIENATDVRLGDSILTYSKDGAHCTDIKGNVLWNQTYEMQDIKMSICQDVAAIGNYNGRNIYIQNSDKQLGQVTTTMPIRDLTVAANGRVTAVMADTDIAYINTYDVEGNQLFKGKASMQESGYPTALSLSPNGELLAISYTYLDAGVMKTNVAFYNFSSVGENQNDHLMSVYAYQDVFIPMIRYMNEDTCFAVGDSMLMIYKGSQKPEQSAQYLYSEEVQSVYFSDKYIGLVFYSDDVESRYRMQVFDTNAKQVGNYYFDTEYSDIFFEENTFTIYNDSECTIMTLDGTVKYEGTFAKTVNLMVPTGTPFQYLLVTDESLDTVQLK